MEEFRKSLEELLKAAKKLKEAAPKGLPATPPPPAAEDHPPKLSEKDAMRMVKGENCMIAKNGQWSLSNKK